MIVVTGAGGVIGRALMLRLRAERLPCVGLGRDAFTGGGSLAARLPRRPSALVHLAAVVPQPPVIADDQSNATQTRQVDGQVLEAAQRWDCPVVYASGCSLYPKNTENSKSEEEAQLAVRQASPYLAAKQDGEKAFLDSGRATVLRISAPLGPGLPSCTVAMRFLLAARTGGEIGIWGSGRREQNYVDVSDIADALVRSVILRPTVLINIAADRPVTMLELAKETVNACGCGSVSMLGNLDPHDCEPARYANQRAIELLGWRPQVPMRTSLERMNRCFQ